MKTKLHNWLWLVCMLLIVTGAWPAHAFYNPTTGCWLSRDPIEEEGGINLLSFALGNPVSVIDVLGSAPRNEAIVVVVPSEPDGGYDTSEASFVLDVNKKKDRKGWLVFEVAGIKDANTKMANANCDCIKELNILGHGDERGGIQHVSGIRDANANSREGRLRAKLNEQTKRYDISGVEIFANLKPKFCKPCVVYLRGCRVGHGPAGRSLVKAVANATGCKAKAWSGNTTELTPYHGLPGSGFAGVQAGPDIEENPDPE